MVTGYRVRIDYGNIRGLFRAGGPGGKWIYRVSTQMVTAARAAAPARSGQLKAKHAIENRRGNQSHVKSYDIVNTAPHAEWVHGGVSGWIYPTRATRLVIPAGAGHGRTFARRVKGQSANPWLDRACTAVAARYGAVPVGL